MALEHKSVKKSKKCWNKRGLEEEQAWDAIIIGSGMGGMTTAATLAKLGKRILVIEQHYVPGGFTHMFRRKSYEWDVGVHAVGEVTEHSLTGRMLSYLTDGALEWSSLGEVYDEFYFPDDFRIDFPDNPRQFRQNLLDAFPDEQEAIDKFLHLVREVAGSMKSYYLARTMNGFSGRMADLFLARKAQKYLNVTTNEILDGLTDNPKLRAIFTAQWGYYGSTPSRSSFAIQALVNKHFLHGGYYPKGGSKKIAEYLLKTVADAGGWTRISTGVKEILLENERAVGVCLDDGTEVKAPIIVSAVGILSTVKRLLPASYQDTDWCKEIEKLPPAPAHVCLYIGFKGDITKAGAGAANKWFYNTWNTEMDAWDVSDPDNIQDAPCLYCSFPSLKDPDHDPGEEQLHTGEVVTFVPWDAFSDWFGTRWQKRGDDYLAYKKKIQDALLEQFLKELPELRSMVDYVELSTPLTTESFCRPMKGSIYGLEPTPERFQNRHLRAKSSIKGLYFSGSEVATVGVIGAMMGGVLAAAAIEPRAVMKLMRKL